MWGISPSGFLPFDKLDYVRYVGDDRLFREKESLKKYVNKKIAVHMMIDFSERESSKKIRK